MTIKEKLEKAKANAKRRVRKAAIGAALVGTLGAGAVSCGEANIKKDNNKNKAEISAQITSYDDNAYLFEEENHGVPIMKHAKNKNEPDSVLTKVEVDDNGNVISKKYAAVKRSDKDTEAKLRTNISRKAGDFTITEKWGRKVPLHKAKAMDYDEIYEENAELYEREIHGNKVMKRAEKANEPDSLLANIEIDKDDKVINKKYVAVEPDEEEQIATTDVTRHRKFYKNSTMPSKSTEGFIIRKARAKEK